MAASNSNPLRKDPLPAFGFQVEIYSIQGKILFKSVSGLRYETESVPVKAGGANDRTYLLPGSVKWSNLVLRNGFSGDPALLAWYEAWLSGTQRARSNGRVVQLNNALKPVAEWSFESAWPVKWELSELDAGKSELSIETLELAHEGLRFKKVG